MGAIPLSDEFDMETNASRYKDLGPLHTLLLKACPPNPEGRQSIPTLAAALGISHQYVYKWINTNHVPASFVTKMVELGEGRADAVTLEDFHPYVFQ